MQGVAHAEDVGAGIGGGQANGGGTDDAGVEQVAELGTSGEGRGREAEHGRGAEDHDPDPDPQVDPLVVDEP